MGLYNDFDLDIKTVQAQNDAENKDNGAVPQVAEAATASCGWLTTSCSSHCR